MCACSAVPAGVLHANPAAVCSWSRCHALLHLFPQPRAPGQFPFPHFMVIGFPKCATTSLYW